MKTTLKKAVREINNPLFGIEIPKKLLPGQEMQWFKKLVFQKKVRIPAPTAEILPLQARLRPVLKKAWSNGSERDISWMCADLAGLWEASRMRIILVKKLLKMGGKLDKDKLREFSIDLDINWFVNAPGHMQTLKHELGRFRAGLFGRSRVSNQKGKRHRTVASDRSR